MKKPHYYFFTFAALLLALSSASASASEGDSARYAVTITNLTRGEIFTPIVVASHRRNVRLFKLGQPASQQLEELAESGNTKPWRDVLLQQHKALQVVSADGVLAPGKSLTLTVRANSAYPRISVASMLVPSNDAFFALNAVHLPKSRRVRSYYSPAYDAGSEHNDELCVSIPGPPFICQGEGTSAASGEGYVHIHAGIHGIGDLNAAQHDWRNPVARVSIRRLD